MPKLFIIPTPIGNLKDITLRAIETLKEMDWLLAEDTRVTRKLLLHFEITVEIQSYHQHNEHKKLDSLVARIKESEKVGLVSDAGTPGISDPGFLIIRECLSNGIEVECLPGPAAFIPALVKSGFPTDRFIFEGFLPHKKGRMKRLESIKDEARTVIFYESPYRIIKLLEQVREALGPARLLSISREISKIYEETINGTADELIAYYTTHPVKGEFVVVIKGIEKEERE